MKYYYWLCLVIRWGEVVFFILMDFFYGYLNNSVEKASKISRCRIASCRLMVRQSKKEELMVLEPSDYNCCCPQVALCSLLRDSLVENFEN